MLESFLFYVVPQRHTQYSRRDALEGVIRNKRRTCSPPRYFGSEGPTVWSYLGVMRLVPLVVVYVKHARLLRISRNENERNENNHINRHPPHRITISILLLCRFDKLFLVLYLARYARNERILCHNLFGIVERSPHGRRGTDWLAHTAYCISHATVLFVYHFLLLFNSVDCGMNK